MRISHFPLLFVLAAALLALSACDSATTEPPDDQEDIPVPSAYAFESRFAENAGAVAYPGQVTRNLLIQDLKIIIDGLAADGAVPVTEDELLARYEYDDAGLAIVTGTDPAAQQQRYNQIATGKSLAGKTTAEYSDQDLIGAGVTADERVRAYLAQIAANSQDAAKLGTPAVYTTPEGVNMSQIVNKVLLGAVVYAQGTAKYLSDDILSSTGNASPRQEGESFSELGHVWDEAYGYFGAARNFTDFSDDGLAEGYGVYHDVDGDGTIDFESEYNFTFSTYAAKRDVGGSGVDFTQEIFEALLRGRTAIINEQPIGEILEHRDAAREAWEQVVAANVVHYLNSTQSDLEDVTSAQRAEKNNAELNEHWSEAKGFAWALQYNPARALTGEQLRQLHTLLGAAPPYGDENAEEDLAAAKQLLQQAYGFSDANMASW